jgi:hypothetical protein
MSEHEGPEDVGASTERFEAFMKQGDDLDRRRPGNSSFRIFTLVIGLVVLGGVVWLLLR